MTLETLALLLMPAAGLLMAVIMLYIVKRDSDQEDKPRPGVR
ncbi:hypothetical protein [Oceanibaculum pacificum]|nr:hypothetical protein [Oceanibaculum pacificum]